MGIDADSLAYECGVAEARASIDVWCIDNDAPIGQATAGYDAFNKAIQRSLKAGDHVRAIVAFEHLTQRERARICVRLLRNDALHTVAYHGLMNALGDAQNGLPDGEADGSIPEALWTRLRDMAVHFGAIEQLYGQLKAAR